tara:strand:- start:824 stop:1525 length:702 start_codon:yes stop_codon:yes gene_type:complete
MEINSDFETFLLISSKKLTIYVNSKIDKKIYEKELTYNLKKNDLIIDKLDFFLNENIFKIEKKLKNFIKKIYIILDSENFFPIEISLKKNDYENFYNSKSLNYLLNEAKDSCKKTIDDRNLIHMIITNYRIDEKSYSSLPTNIEGNTFSIDVKFICISNNFIKSLIKVLKKYQISLGQVVSAKYVSEFPSQDKNNIFIKTKKIMNGLNPNEVLIVDKSIKNSGFFEKFFNFFS